MIRKPGLPLAAFLTILMCGAACSTTNAVAPKSADSAITTQIYPVKDLVFARTPVAALGRGETEGAYIQIADLITNIREATDPQYWETEGTAIRAEESGFLQVEATPAMQQQVAQVLSDMRRFAAKK